MSNPLARGAYDTMLCEWDRAGMSAAEMGRTLGISRARIEYRLIRLGLRAGHTCAGDLRPPPETVTRKCLKCGAPFPSDWIGNRVCRACKGTRAWRDGGEYGVGR